MLTAIVLCATTFVTIIALYNWGQHLWTRLYNHVERAQTRQPLSLGGPASARKATALVALIDTEECRDYLNAALAKIARPRARQAGRLEDWTAKLYELAATEGAAAFTRAVETAYARVYSLAELEALADLRIRHPELAGKALHLNAALDQAAKEVFEDLDARIARRSARVPAAAATTVRTSLAPVEASLPAAEPLVEAKVDEEAAAKVEAKTAPKKTTRRRTPSTVEKEVFTALGAPRRQPEPDPRKVFDAEAREAAETLQLETRVKAQEDAVAETRKSRRERERLEREAAEDLEQAARKAKQLLRQSKRAAKGTLTSRTEGRSAT